MIKKFVLVFTVLLLAFPFTSFAGGAQESEDTPVVVATPEPEYSYEKLVELAKAEGELVVYDTSSKIVSIGEAFTAKYGISVKATKMKNPEQIERVKREVDANNVQVDVIGISDSSILVNDLLPQNYVSNWIPPDLADKIPLEFQYPLTYRMGQRIMGFNYETYASSPVENIWQLTEAEWSGKVFLGDPATTPATLAFFTSLTKPEYAAILETAYKDYYGKSIELTEENAGWEFLVRFFKNDPVVMKSDGDVANAVGSQGQKEPPLGFYTYAKQRDNADGLRLKVAFEMKPFIGYASGTHAVMVNGSAHPNAAKLFIRFLLTREGVAPHMKNIGVYSTNMDIPVHADDKLGAWEDWSKYMVVLDNELTWEIGQDILDLWLIHTGM